MRCRRPTIVVALAISVVLSAGCRSESPDDSTSADATALYRNVLEHRGAPEAPEDWSFAPFSDNGSWAGFAVPPKTRKDLRGGFVGPFLMTGGRWIGPQLAKLVLYENGAEIALDADVEWSADALPGRLEQRFQVDELVVTVELWFASSSTALVRGRLRNDGGVTRRIEPVWAGTVFPDQATLDVVESSVLAHVDVDGTAGTGVGPFIRIDADRPVRASLDAGDAFTLKLAEPIELAAGETTDVTLALTMPLTTAAASEAVANSFAFEDFGIRASFRNNVERWNRYLDSVDTGVAPEDPRQIVAVKSLLTLVNNWRGPAGRLRHGGLFPSSNIHYFNGFWAWDSWKHAVALVQFDARIAKDQVREMFDHQDDRGMVADVVYLDPAEDNWRDSKPPLAGWAVEAIFDATGDTAFVREMYPKLVAYHRFWYADRDHDGDGLCEYGSTDGTLTAARWESGMDNAVRFDSTSMLQNGPAAWSMDQESVDLNSYLYREKLALQKLAEASGRPDRAADWKRQAEQLLSRIRSAMYDDASGWFYDIGIDSGEIVPVQGPEGWIPLWAGVATDEQAARVRETMLDPGKFRTHAPFPTVARDDAEFSDGYWRGLVWLDQAGFAIEGLRRYGYDSDADALTRQLLSNLEGAAVPGEPLRENYHPLTGEGQNARHFSWTAAHLLLLVTDPGFKPPGRNHASLSVLSLLNL